MVWLYKFIDRLVCKHDWMRAGFNYFSLGAQAKRSCWKCDKKQIWKGRWKNDCG